MILLLLNFISRVCAVAGRIISPFLLIVSKSEKTKVFLSERSVLHWTKSLRDAGNSTLLTGKVSPVTYWVHVASAGELEQVIPIMRSLHEKYHVVFFLTYFSPSAIPFLKNCPGLIGATSLTWENQSAYQCAIDSLKIKRLILVRYDFWPILISVLRKNSLPVCVVSATLRKARSPLPEQLQHTLRKVWFAFTDAVFLINESEKNLLTSYGMDEKKIFVAGDAKWNRALERALKARSKPLSSALELLKMGLHNSFGEKTHRVIVFGSPHQEELEVLQKYLACNPVNTTLIVAPHDVGEKTIARTELNLQGKNVQILRITECERPDWSVALSRRDCTTVVLLNTFGFLAEAYALADLAIVGGGFDGQLHNVLEPAALLVPTLYGNRSTRAPEAQILLTHNAAVGFANPEMLFQFLVQWGTLESEDVVRSEITQKLTQVRAHAKSLFASLPDPSEVVCRALASRDALETN